MKIRFKALSADNPVLFPKEVFSKIPTHHPVRLVSEVINQLDITTIIAQYKGGGASSYHPRRLLNVLFFSYLNNV